MRRRVVKRVVRRKRGRSRGLGAVHTTIDLDYVREMSGERAPFFRDTAKSLIKAGCRILDDGEGWGDRKIFLSDLSKAVGIPVKRLGPLMANLSSAGLVNTARADLVAAMDPRKVADSEVIVRGPYGSDSSFHFLEIDPMKCRRR